MNPQRQRQYIIAICLILVILQLQKRSRAQKRARYRPPIKINPLSKRWNFDDIEDSQFKHLMRFSRADLRRLLPLLRLDRIEWSNRNSPSEEEALGVLVFRMAYPRRYLDMMDRFGHGRSWICAVFKDVLIYLYKRYQRILEWDEDRLTYVQLLKYAYALKRHGMGMSIWGWIDGTFISTCRPKELHQRRFYSGHKKQHGIKYQAVVTPDGIVSSLMGPFLGKEGDWRMVTASGLVRRLRAINEGKNGFEMLYLYGDPAYTNQYGIMGPFKKYSAKGRSTDEYRFNLYMSRYRIEVEHAFGKHLNLFQLNEHTRHLKVFQGAAFIPAVSILLTNIHTCLHSSQTSMRMDIEPPSVEKYLQRNEEELAAEGERWSRESDGIVEAVVES